MMSDTVPEGLRDTLHEALIEYLHVLDRDIHNLRRRGLDEAVARREIELANVRALRAHFNMEGGGDV
jgi:hypothetical protein